MKGFFEKQEYTQEDIERIIKEKWEESLKLEFKAAEAISKTQRNEISKDISAFANSGGGILIYGIKEKDHVAADVSFVDGTVTTKEWIEQVINSNIQPKIEGILIFPIRFDSDIRKSVYVVKIPESDKAHMAVNKKYYKRFNFESSPMEEREVRDLYYKSKKTDLSIVDVESQKRSSMGVNGNYGNFRFKINFIVRNDSNYKEDNYKMEFEIPNILIYDIHAEIESFFISTKGKNRIYSVYNESPLFEGEKTSLCPIDIETTKKTFNDPENFVVKIRLYFSNGLKNYEYDLRHHLYVDGKKLNEAVFAEGLE